MVEGRWIEVIQHKRDGRRGQGDATEACGNGQIMRKLGLIKLSEEGEMD